ncbi:MAG: ATP-binding cassette domain-containing protein [Candidatus Cloacimonetes bacterium]|jgi:phospholipid/cholesterol/gamma-HCH transport system ATP-binding protein|nr:ATP-binding cassette domain-containing protein [Candidatus Cloacimonadota bacterium]MDD2506517.1 ATP-binding cassette domain-containing protein [Candidatus Cloacimonadota bacterium]MDD4559845.1 ATP-binding cassette domain-containing protein [Candidatus Cloacimonadota bacterium]
MIAVKELRISLGGREILQGIDFVLPFGENLVILGKSGSGKTVLIKSLLGIYPPDAGSVIIDGIDIYNCSKEELNSIKKRFAMVFQHAALLDSFTVFQNVALPLYERGEKDENYIRQRVQACLQLVGLEHTLKLYPAELSGGMRKRIGIARALVYKPDYLIFDEPVSGLDPITANETLYYMTQIIKNNTATMITITHDISTIDQLGQKVLFIHNGEQIYYDSYKNLMSSDNSIIRKYFS